jgi:hypothetical protein
VESARTRIEAARESLRGQLSELHQYAAQSRAELETVREQLRQEAQRIHEREQQFETARSEHRLAATQFRQQLLEWQARIAEIRAETTRNETQMGHRQAEVAAAALTIDENSKALIRKAAELERERAEVQLQRVELDRHLADMREWYRQKLRELAQPHEPTAQPTDPRELDPGDRQLGELLRRLELVEADTLDSLWAEAQRQRRTLRQVLLTSGVLTLHQLALIESGNLDALVVGRFRVVERVRVQPREVLYKVVDPRRLDSPSRGIFLLRQLGESEARDAVRPDEYRQRFLTLQSVQSPHLDQVLEVLDIANRPAILLDWFVGIPANEWPTVVTTPGVWVRLLQNVVEGIAAAHAMGLVHGRLTADRVVLGADGVVKCLGFGEPAWLQPLSLHGDGADPSLDLRALGRIVERWQQATATRKRGRNKNFPDALGGVVRRLLAEATPPMGDTGGFLEPFVDANDLSGTLDTLARTYPCSEGEWQALLAALAEPSRNVNDSTRQSA